MFNCALLSPAETRVEMEDDGKSGQRTVEASSPLILCGALE